MVANIPLEAAWQVASAALDPFAIAWHLTAQRTAGAQFDAVEIVVSAASDVAVYHPWHRASPRTLR